MNQIFKTFIGVFLGIVFSLSALFLGITALGAGEGIFLPMALGFGIGGSGFFVWPLLGGLSVHLERNYARIFSIILILWNYLGSAYFLVRSSTFELELEGFNYLSVISLLFFASFQAYLWFMISSSKEGP